MNYEVFPFGKYKGWSIEDIPVNYICYALQNMDLPNELNHSLKSVLVEKLNLNDYLENDEYSFLNESMNPKAAYRMMSKKYHPDAGGSDYDMQIINEFYNLMK